MTTLNLQVASGAGDASEAADGTGFASNGADLTLMASADPASRTSLGFFFENVDIPQGATIVSAVLAVRIVDEAFDDVLATIRANDVDDAADFVSEADVTSRARTSAGVAWDATALGIGYVSAPDIAAVIQEVILRPGWTPNNGLCVLVDAADSGTRTLLVYAYETAAEVTAATLTIEWLPAASGAARAAGLRRMLAPVNLT